MNWIPIVESLDLSTLKTLDLCDSSAKQFNSSGDAVDLYNSMFKSTDDKEMEDEDYNDELELHYLDMMGTDLEETELNDTSCEGTEEDDSDIEG
ncbi:hypothetical protein CPC16_008350 [Podila verticillata]|nr:hypothetical protein CPC16_008350 [Podila verticillata]